MPTVAKGPRLYLRKRKGRDPVWVVRAEGTAEVSTGTADRAEAEAFFARWLAERGRRAGGPATAEDLTVGEVLAAYGEHHAPHTADPVRIGYAIEALDRFWADLPVSAVRSETCRRYARSRVHVSRSGATRPIAPGTIRRELGVLSAALRWCHAEGILVAPPRVTLPEKPAPKERWLTRSEIAWMLWACRAIGPEVQHIARFILAGRYTGTRKTALVALRIDSPSIDAGWVDTERGVLYRQGSGARRTKKRQPPARLPGRFLAHVRRWKRQGARFVVETRRGERVGDFRKTWAAVCRRAEDLARAQGVEIDLSGISPHVLRHTAITWTMQAGAEKWDAAGFFGVSLETLERVYGHHHPDHQSSAVRALETGEVGARPNFAIRGGRAAPEISE